jgi:hypothetical protein
MDAQIDYSLRYNGGAYYQHLSRLPGDLGPVYKEYNGDGVIELTDTSLHTVRIQVRDEYGNQAALNFLLQFDDSLAKNRDYRPGEVLIPGKAAIIDKPGFEVYLDKDALYDTLHPYYFRNNSLASFALSAIHQLNDASIPLHSELIVRIKPDRLIPFDWQDKLLIRRNDRKGSTIRKAVWEEQWLSAKFNDLGYFQLFADTIPPKINELGKGDTIDLSPATRIVFTPTENFGLVKKFRAELNGNWIRFTNDKSRSWIYVFDERCPYGVHELKVTVEDLVGNSTTRGWWFKRNPYTPPPPKKKAVKKSNKKPVKSQKKKK